jgi:hypothetical protein
MGDNVQNPQSTPVADLGNLTVVTPVNRRRPVSRSIIAGVLTFVVTGLLSLKLLSPIVFFGGMGCQRAPCVEYLVIAIFIAAGIAALAVSVFVSALVLFVRSRWVLVGVAAYIAYVVVELAKIYRPNFPL